MDCALQVLDAMGISYEDTPDNLERLIIVCTAFGVS